MISLQLLCKNATPAWTASPVSLIRGSRSALQVMDGIRTANNPIAVIMLLFSGAVKPL